MKRGVLFAWILAALLTVIPSGLWAQQEGNIQFGNLSVIPGVGVQEIYDDNIFMGNGRAYADPTKTEQEKKVSDWITHVKPSLLLKYDLAERGYVNLGYRGDFAFYKDNRSNNWKNNQGGAEVKYEAPGGLILGITELFVAAEDPYGSADQYGIGRVTKRWTNDVKTKLGYTIASNFRSFLYYNNYRQKYQDALDYAQNYTDNEYGIGTEMRFLPKTWGFLRYHYGVRKYNTSDPLKGDEFNSDGTWHRVSTGLGWDPGAKLSGELNVGYEWRRYDHSQVEPGQTTQREGKNTWVASTSLNYLPTETTTLGLSLMRAIRNTNSDTNEQFIDTGIGLTVQQKLLDKVLLNGGITYSRNEYNLPVGNERTDTNYLATVGVEYNIREWLGIGVAYNFNRKDSNDETQEFVDNQFLATLRIVY